MKMLAHDALTHAVRVFELVKLAALNSRSGNDAQVRALLHRADALVAAELPVLRGVLAAQGQAAKELHLSQRPAVGLGVEPHEHPHPANDHNATPELPAPTVA
ncbi:hypothetical protein [Brevundimonas sp. FT23028]|uniref:hypothetical protein n=1 Tax=Brevundimonas sp. FT23028 TaxID=3393748 RepID=UPI003B585CC2